MTSVLKQKWAQDFINSIKDKSIIIIPARYGSSRLPGKPLADINGIPMIIRVWHQAQKSGFATIIIATDSNEIADSVRSAGGNVVMTSADHQSGTDRIKQALDIIDHDKQYQFIINLQGDLPTISGDTINCSVLPLVNDEAMIATLGYRFDDEVAATNPNVAKIVANFSLKNDKLFRALYFTRARCPYGKGDYIGHIGIYVYRRSALEKFVSLPVSSLEQREKLEQLRAVENNMRIDACLVENEPPAVDTPDDLKRIRAIIAAG